MTILRDITMIFSVLLSVVSVGFGLYKNIEAGNARGFAYEQAYRVMGTVQQANISGAAKANILNAALGSLAVPPPVVDLSRSSADQPKPEACSETQRAECAALATQLGETNASCARMKEVACPAAAALKKDIIVRGCFVCF